MKNKKRKINLDKNFSNKLNQYLDKPYFFPIFKYNEELDFEYLEVFVIEPDEPNVSDEDFLFYAAEFISANLVVECDVLNNENGYFGKINETSKFYAPSRDNSITVNINGKDIHSKDGIRLFKFSDENRIPLFTGKEILDIINNSYYII